MVGGAGQWASGARTGRSGPRVSEGALRERSRGSRREVEEGKWSEGADRRAPSVSDGRRGCEVMRVTRKRREEQAGALRGSRPGWAACCWAAAGRREKGWAAQGYVWAGHWVGLDLGLVSWAGLSFVSISISSFFPILIQTKFEFKYKFEFKPHSNN